MNEESSNKIFLSYHSSKVELVAHLARNLEKNNLRTWYAARDIHAGEDWDNAINLAIKNCKAVVLLFCAQADASIQVKRELSLADRYKKPIFWIRVERVEPNNLSYFLTATQWFDWLDMRDATLEKLVHDIHALDVGGKAENGPAPQLETNIEPLPQSDWTKGVFAFDTDREAAECAARVYAAMAQKNPYSSVILPTGRSATLVFRAMLKIADEFEGNLFGDAHILSDTETFGVWKEHDTSRTRHIIETLIEPLSEKGKAPDQSQLCLLSGIYTDSEPIKTAQKTIRNYPPSVHAVSVSPVGEILAYEVGTYNEIDDIIDDAPRIVEVGEHSKKYIDPNQPSKSIITIGMGTALSASVLLLLFFDVQKANILRRMFTSSITSGIPATILRYHPNAYILTTKSIATEAKISDFTITGSSAKEAAERITSQ